MHQPDKGQLPTYIGTAIGGLTAIPIFFSLAYNLKEHLANNNSEYHALSAFLVCTVPGIVGGVLSYVGARIAENISRKSSYSEYREKRRNQRTKSLSSRIW